MLSRRGAALAFVGLVMVVAVVATWRVLPRYELRSVNPQITYRIDQWTGDVAVLRLDERGEAVLMTVPTATYDREIRDHLDAVQRDR